MDRVVQTPNGLLLARGGLRGKAISFFIFRSNDDLVFVPSKGGYEMGRKATDE